MTFLPLANYAGYEHVLNAAPCFVHPGNGTLYGCAIEKRGGVQQDLSIYRVRRGSDGRELVKRYLGGKDAVSQFAMGGCAILQDGTMEVWAALVPPAAPTTTKTGFQACWLREPNVDDPWGGADARLATLAAHLADVEAVMHETQNETARVRALAESISGAGLDAGDREALDRLRVLLRI